MYKFFNDENYFYLHDGNLHLKLYDWWYNLYVKGYKTVDYRELGVKWSLRLISNLIIESEEGNFVGIIIPEKIEFYQFRKVIFENMNNIYAVKIVKDIKKIDIGTGILEMGAKPDNLYFRIHV